MNLVVLVRVKPSATPTFLPIFYNKNEVKSMIFKQNCQGKNAYIRTTHLIYWFTIVLLDEYYDSTILVSSTEHRAHGFLKAGKRV